MGALKIDFFVLEDLWFPKFHCWMLEIPIVFKTENFTLSHLSLLKEHPQISNTFKIFDSFRQIAKKMSTGLSSFDNNFLY